MSSVSLSHPRSMSHGAKTDKLALRVIIVIAIHIVVGFCLAWLLRIRLGSDPCSTFNVGVSNHLPISFGTWSLLFQAVLLAIVLRFDRSKLGIGTLVNMSIPGYAADFFGWIIDSQLDASFFEPWAVRAAICIPALAVFVVAVSIYMAVDMGVSAYDALPYIITDHQSKFTFRGIRTIFDVTVLGIGVALGGDFGIVSIIMAFSLGSVITLVSRKVKALLFI